MTSSFGNGGPKLMNLFGGFQLPESEARDLALHLL
jgi:hypothetical protein